MARKRFEWKTSRNTLVLGDRTFIMGVLNVTPDSFSDGGRYAEPERAYSRALQLEDEGADVIDIGAESTKPGSARVSEHTEIERLSPVLKRLAGKLQVPISVDTYKPAVAEFALQHGAEIINDPSGLTWEPEIAKVALKYDAGLIINHMRGTPETWAKLGPLRDLSATVAKELESAIHRAARAGVRTEQLMVDPGLGFGKRKEQNSELLAQLDLLAKLNVPVMVGPSRKSFLARPTELETSYANAAAVTIAILGGAHVVRVHEVKEMRIAIQLADSVLAGVRTEDVEGRDRSRSRAFEENERSTRPVRRFARDDERQNFGPPSARNEDSPARRTFGSKPAAEQSRSFPLRRTDERTPEPETPRDNNIPGREDLPPGDRPYQKRDRSEEARPYGRDRFDNNERGERNRSPRSFSDRPDRPPRSSSDRPDRPPRSFSDRPDRPPRNFSDRPDRPPRTFSDRPERPPRSFTDRKDSSFSDRSGGRSDRGPYGVDRSDNERGGKRFGRSDRPFNASGENKGAGGWGGPKRFDKGPSKFGAGRSDRPPAGRGPKRSGPGGRPPGRPGGGKFGKS